jgi:hypothetical protein
MATTKARRTVDSVSWLLAFGICAGCSASPSNVPMSRIGTAAPMSPLPSNVLQPSAAGTGFGSGNLDNAPMLIDAPKPGTVIDAGLDAGDVCNASMTAAQQVPVDVYMMIDQSLSMVALDDAGNSRWDDVIGALTQFVQSPDSAGLNVGVQYFGLGLAGSSCEPSDYAVPEVEIGSLPSNATALINSFAAHGPSSVTPTLPAIQGAVQHAQAFKMSNPSHSVVVLLVTDGEPDFCGADLLGDSVNAAAAGVAAMPSIATYVLGVGTSLDNLNQIAMAGGTGQAYIVDGTSNISTQVVTALNKIRGNAALPCEFQIPPPDPGMKFDFTKVNLSYVPPGGQSTVVPYAADPTACNAAALAWHYDDPSRPTKILLCDNTCKAVSSGGEISIALHCPTVPIVLN